MQIGSVWTRLYKQNISHATHTPQQNQFFFLIGWFRAVTHLGQDPKEKQKQSVNSDDCHHIALPATFRGGQISVLWHLCPKKWPLSALVDTALWYPHTHGHKDTHVLYSTHWNTHGPLVLLMPANLCSETRAASLALMLTLSFTSQSANMTLHINGLQRDVGAGLIEDYEETLSGWIFIIQVTKILQKSSSITFCPS